METTNDPTQPAASREQELETQLKRALADYANIQRRYEKEKSDTARFANEVLMIQLLPIVDALAMTLNQFQSLLKHTGFEQKTVNAGEKFDANHMEATESDGTGEIVQEVYSPAYLLHGKIIQPAKVKVGKEINKNE